MDPWTDHYRKLTLPPPKSTQPANPAGRLHELIAERSVLLGALADEDDARPPSGTFPSGG